MKFTFTQEEANVILQALAKQPFEQVYLLVASIQNQAREQLLPKTKKIKKEI